MNGRRRGVAMLVAAGLTVAGCASFDTWQRQAIFQTGQDQSRWHRDPPPGTEQFDRALADGDQVHMWYRPADVAGAPTVLYLHGTRWNLNNSVFRFERLHALGFNVLALDYRGFGRSTSRLPSQDSAAEDVRLGLQELARREPDASRRFLYGHSLGGALAIQAAAGPQPPVAGLIVESTFTSIADIVSESRWGWIPGLGWLVSQRFDSAARIGDVMVPTLFIHGTADRVVPASMSEKLHASARAVPPGYNGLLLVEGGSHSGASRVDPATYDRTLRAFATRAIALAGGPRPDSVAAGATAARRTAGEESPAAAGPMAGRAEDDQPAAAPAGSAGAAAAAAATASP